MREREALNLLLDLSVANGRISQAMEEVEYAINQDDDDRDLIEENEEEILEMIEEAEIKLEEIRHDYGRE